MGDGVGEYSVQRCDENEMLRQMAIVLVLPI